MIERKIPSTWEACVLSDLGTICSGGTPSTKIPEFWGDEIPWISPSDLTGYTAKYIARGAKSLSKKGLTKSSAKLMPAGSVHFSSRAPIGYLAISSQSLCTNQGFKSLTPADGVFNEYVYFYLKSIKGLANSLATGTTFKELSGREFAKLPFPLPPLNEQKRIVAKIEELFSELDAGEESLRQARRQLGGYRQSLLKQAFEGKLTTQWRKQNPDVQEWPYVPLESLVSFTNGFAFKSKEYNEDGIPVVRISDISAAGVSLDNCARIEGSTVFDRFQLQQWDILIAMSGATTGKFGQLKSDQKCYQNQRVGCFRTKDENIMSQGFVLQLLEGLKRRIEKDAYGGAQPNISGKQINAYEIPVPSPSEQQEIVRLLDEQFTVIEQNERELDAALKRSEALRQSILKKAFTGHLVPQDPTDEPAKELLARIREEREEAILLAKKTVKKTTQKSKKSAKSSKKFT